MRFLFGVHVLDLERRELHRDGSLISVEPQVFDLLVYLVRHRDRVVSKGDLLAAVWRGRIVSDTTIDSRVKAARQAVADSGAAQQVIRTIPRKGVRFVSAVKAEENQQGSEVSKAIFQCLVLTGSLGSSCAGRWWSSAKRAKGLSAETHTKNTHSIGVSG